MGCCNHSIQYFQLIRAITSIHWSIMNKTIPIVIFTSKISAIIIIITMIITFYYNSYYIFYCYIVIIVVIIIVMIITSYYFFYYIVPIIITLFYANDNSSLLSNATNIRILNTLSQFSELVSTNMVEGISLH